jgi:hypothetical protein
MKRKHEIFLALPQLVTNSGLSVAQPLGSRRTLHYPGYYLFTVMEKEQNMSHTGLAHFIGYDPIAFLLLLLLYA